MGPMYACRHDPAAAAATRTRGILSPEAINRAFAPGGFLQTFDLRPELPRITAPTLVLAGRHDWICAPEFSEEIAHLIPHARLRIFEHSSHSIRVDEPEAMIDEIRRFIGAGLEPRGA
jgi:proline iminopeptidase